MAELWQFIILKSQVVVVQPDTLCSTNILWKITVLYGKIHYKLPFSLAMLQIYQRDPEGKSPQYHHIITISITINQH